MIRKSSDPGRGDNGPARRHLVKVVLALVRANADQTHRVDQLAADRFGLNTTDARALELVSRTGPLTAKSLARALGMTTGGVTTVIDRLERAGYARRRDDANDRRRVLIEATELTRRVESEIFGELIRDTARLVESYSGRDLAVIKGFMEQSGAQLAAHIERMSGNRRTSAAKRRGRRPR